MCSSDLPALSSDGSPCGEVRVAVWSPKYESNLCLALVSSKVAGGPFTMVLPSGEVLAATHLAYFAE